MDDLILGLRHLPMKFSKNKLTVHVDAADPTLPIRSGMISHAEILSPEAFQSPTYVKIGERVGSEKPVSQLAGLPYYYGTDFDIQTILDGKLSYSPPSLKSSNLQLCPSLTIPFKVHSFVEKNNTIIAGTDDNSTAQFCLKAGLKTDDYSGWKDSYFTTYYDENLPFLTNQQNEKSVGRLQPEFLYFLVNFLPKPITLKLRVKVYFNDGTDATITDHMVSSINQFSVYSVGVGFAQLGLWLMETIVKKVVSWQVWINNETDGRVSQIRSFELNERFYRNERYLVFSTSLGGYDTLRVTGVGRDTLKTTRQKGERELENNYLPTASEIFVTGVTGELELAVNTGFLDADTTAYLSEILLSEDIYVVTKHGLVPISFVDDTLLLSEDNVDITSRTFTFTYSKKELAYSDLPVAPAAVGRAFRWSPSGSYCLYNPDTGLATGFQGATILTLVYADNNEIVKGVPPKNNTPGTDGYYPPQLSNTCPSGYAPFKNTLISRTGTIRKDDCVGGFGNFATVIVAANTYGGLTADEAQNRAEELWAILNTQAFANANAGCIAAPEFYNMNPAPVAGRFNFRFTLGIGISNNLPIYIHGGPGASNNDPTSLVHGNHWAIQNNTNPSSVKYPTGQNDCALPCVIAGGYLYLITIPGFSQSRRMRYYVNGIVKVDITITAVQFQANGGGHIHALDASVFMPNGSYVYVLLENI